MTNWPIRLFAAVLLAILLAASVPAQESRGIFRRGLRFPAESRAFQAQQGRLREPTYSQPTFQAPQDRLREPTYGQATLQAPHSYDLHYRYVPSPHYELYPQFYGGFHARHLQIYAYPGGQAGFRGAPW
jgi:hypothetical protein